MTSLRLRLKEFARDFPHVKFGLGVLGMSTIATLIFTRSSNIRITTFGLSVVFTLMVGLFLFGVVASLGGEGLRRPAIVLVWLQLLLLVLVQILAVSSFYFGWPKAIGNAFLAPDIDVRLAETWVREQGGTVRRGSQGNAYIIDLGNTHVTDAWMENLLPFRDIEELILSNTPVTDASIPTLLKLKHLERLHLDETQITDDGVEQLKSTFPSLTVSVGSEPPPINLGEPLFIADFTDPSTRFYPLEQSDETSEISRDLRLRSPGRLLARIKRPQSSVQLWTDFTVINFAATFKVTIESEVTSGSYGMTFRSQGDKYLGSAYRLQISAYREQLAIFKGVSGSFTLLGEWKEFSPVEKGNPTTVWLIVDGAKMTVYVNGEHVLDLTDDTYEQGKMAIEVASAAEPGLQVAFERFAVYGLARND